MAYCRSKRKYNAFTECRSSNHNCSNGNKRQRKSSRLRKEIARCPHCSALHREINLDSKELLRTLEIDYWKRSEECSRRKKEHMERIEGNGTVSMEDWVLQTTLKGTDHAMEKNQFPYLTPRNIEHWTLWALHEMDRREIERFVYDYIRKNMPDVVAWEYDENSHRSIHIFHVHVYLKFKDRSRRKAEYETPPRDESKSRSHSEEKESRRSRSRSSSCQRECSNVKSQVVKSQVVKSQVDVAPLNTN
eukprot:CAMPEP_0185252956 /NCGR_PEP_ID=MMETSP1359-20130426/1893_1 /TAXON_ID=552665 /ORGANISM="Bigelowiella longifila, Strain CCMP242" /LENGTH=246 /DNA_ID=CAMNT_0027835247 /DNA_START=235 /DNA_END=975 /DNA_ORIENTATION=+